MLTLPAAAQSATLTWVGGSGNWDTTSLNWSGTTWSNLVPDDAVFAGTLGTVTLTENITSGTITATTSGYTISSSGANALTVSRIDISSLGANGQLDLGAKLTGNSALSLAGAGDTTDTGGGNANLGIRLTNSANDFVGDVTITDRLVSYTANSVFGNAANKIIMDGGGLLDNNVSVNLARDIEVRAGGGIIRFWNASVATWSGALSGTGNIRRTDMGTLTLSGNLSTYSGTFTQVGASAIATVITGGGTVGGSWTQSAGTITFNSASNQTAGGVFSGSFVKSGAGALTLTNATVGGNWTVNTGGGLVVQSSSSQSMGGVISGAGTVTKAGSGTLALSGASTFTGNMLFTSGTVQDGYQAAVNNPTATGIGNMMTAGRTVTTSTGAALVFTASDAIGNYNILVTSTLVADGGTITRTSGAFNSIGNLELRNGGRLTSQNGQNGTVNSFALNGNVAVTGTAASFIDTAGSSNNGIHLGTAGTTNTFDVADVTGNASADLTVSAPLINAVFGAAAGLSKTGAGTLTMSGANSFSGNMTINAGTVVANSTANNSSPSATSLGNMTTAGRTITTNTGATLRFDASDAIGQFDYTTPVTLIADGGTITRVANTTTFNAIGSVTLRNGGRLTTTNGNASTVGSFAINGSVTVSGTTGSFIDTLSGQTTNSYVNLGTNSNNATTFDVAATGDPTADLTVSAVLGDKVLGGAAALVKTGSGTMLMAASNSFTGGTTLRAGTLVTRTNNGFGSGGSITINDASTGAANTRLLIDATGGTVTMGRSITVANQGSGATTIGAAANSGGNFATFSGAITLNKNAILTSGSSGDRTEFTGGISGTGSVTITGPGSRVIYRSTATTYTGSTTINAGGVLQISDGSVTSASFLADTQPVVVNGVLSLAKGSNSETIGGLFGTGTVQNLVGGVTSTLIVGGGNASGTFSGLLANPSGTLAIEKTGAGTQVISGNNTYSGATTISGGRLTAGHANAFGTVGAVTIGSSGTLGIADGVTFTRPLTINAGGKVFAGNNSTVALPNAAALSAWESQNTAGGDQTYSRILSGSGSTVPSALTTAWTSNPNTSLYHSDILTLEGTGTNNVYVLSMTYRSIFGDMNIWYRDDVSSPFTPLGTSSQGNVAWNSSFATVGQYGLDTTAGTVWVVTDHNSQFVVVPEPGSLATATVALAALALRGAFVMRRRRRASGSPGW